MPTDPTALSDTLARWYDEAEQARLEGLADAARSGLERILAHDPRHPGALFSCGLLAFDAKQFDGAYEWVSRAIEVAPQAAFYDALCVVQIKRRAFPSAVEAAREGLALDPTSRNLHYCLGVALQVSGHPEEAALAYRRLLELQPDDAQTRAQTRAQAHANLAVVIKDLGFLDDAERHLKQALALAPANLGARASLATVLLAAGRYEEAWPLFEDRWANFVGEDGSPVDARVTLPMPQWRGEPVQAAGARLLVLPEQGHGDSLQFVRYLPLALERFERVGYICPPSLRRLYEESLCARWPGLVMLDDTWPEAADWDWHCPLMSLPLAFGTRLDSVPHDVYLNAEPHRVAVWGERLASAWSPPLPRVGIVWAGGHSGLTEDRARSLSPRQLAPLLALPFVNWISLQKTDDPAKRADPSVQARLIDCMDAVTDFADTAALIANLDLVIAVDTSVAHLAAAMGKSVWLLNRFAGCWRWLRDRDDSPWYPGVRIFTQTRRGNWDEVLERVSEALLQRFGRSAERMERAPASPSP